MKVYSDRDATFGNFESTVLFFTKTFMWMSPSLFYKHWNELISHSESLKNYLFEKAEEERMREEGKKRESSPTAGSFLKCLKHQPRSLSGWQRTRQFSHHVLSSRVHFSRKLEPETEPALKPRHVNVRLGFQAAT